MVKIMELVHGKDVVQKVMNTKNYNMTTKVTASKNNILGYFGKQSFTQNKRARNEVDVDDDNFRELCIVKRSKQMKINET
jgi:hypothetical protein